MANTILKNDVLSDNLYLSEEVNTIETEHANDNLPAPLPAYSNALAIPTDPKELAQFAKTGNLKVSAAKKLIKTHNFQAKEDRDNAIKQMQSYAEIVLRAEYELAKIIGSPPSGITKRKMCEQLDISRKKWLMIRELTPELIEGAIEYANDNNDYATRYRALEILKEQKKEAAQKKSDDQELERINNLKKAVSIAPKAGKFPVVYMDLSSNAELVTAAQIEEIKALTTDDSILFLWVGYKQLLEAFSVIASLGFSYKEQVIWDKGKLGIGNWSQNQHENLLIATKGNTTIPDTMYRIPSVYFEKLNKKDTNTKPDYYFEMIEKICPNQAYLEVFSERKYSTKWTIFNNELNNSTTNESN